MRIALIHAITAAIAPVHEAFAKLWPKAEYTDLLDTALLVDREREGELTPAMTRRIGALAEYAAGTGAAAAARSPLPVLKPNEAMFDAAMKAGKRIGMLATFQPAVASLEDEFRALAALRGSPATIETVCVESAMQALRAGDFAMHDRILAAAAP